MGLVLPLYPVSWSRSISKFAPWSGALHEIEANIHYISAPEIGALQKSERSRNRSVTELLALFSNIHASFLIYTDDFKSRCTIDFSQVPRLKKHYLCLTGWFCLPPWYNLYAYRCIVMLINLNLSLIHFMLIYFVRRLFTFDLYLWHYIQFLLHVQYAFSDTCFHLW